MDFGRSGPVPGARRVASALIPVASRHRYLNVTHSQKPPEVIDGLKDAWMSFGGVPPPTRHRQPEAGDRSPALLAVFENEKEARPRY